VLSAVPGQAVSDELFNYLLSIPPIFVVIKHACILMRASGVRCVDIYSRRMTREPVVRLKSSIGIVPY